MISSVDRILTYWFCQATADKLGIPYIETSAMDSTNVEASFEEITRRLLQSREPSKSKSVSDKGVVKIGGSGSESSGSGKKGCC